MNPQHLYPQSRVASDGNSRRIKAGLLIAVVILLLLAALLYRRQSASSAITPTRTAQGFQRGPRGRITAVTGNSLTISSRRGGSHTYTLTPSTAITLDGHPATTQALTVGQGARITSPDGVTATEVALRTRRAGGGWRSQGGPASRQ